MPAVIDRQIRNYIIHGLAEGLSIRSLERMFGANKETILRYQLLVGKACSIFLDKVMRNLNCRALEADEFWSYIYKKQAQVNRKKKSGYDHEGDIWTYVALDPKTKLVPAHWVGMRERYDTRCFMEDVATRLMHRIHLSTDALVTYPDAVDNAFGPEVDNGQVTKIFGPQPDPHPTRGVSGHVVGIRREVICGHPRHISTSMIEKQNHTARMHIRRISPGHQRLLEKADAFQGRGRTSLRLLQLLQDSRHDPDNALGRRGCDRPRLDAARIGR